MSGLVAREGERLSSHTPCRTGGPCERWMVAHDEAAVLEAVALCRSLEMKLTVVGAMTRSPARDGALPGAWMRLGVAFTAVQQGDGDWVVGAAYPLSALSGAAARAGRSGLEARICGAGSAGASILLDEGWEGIVAEVAIVRRNGVSNVSLEEARKKRPIVLSARLTLPSEDPAKVSARTFDLWRRQRPIPAGSWYEVPDRGEIRSLLGSVKLPMVRLRSVAIPAAAPELLINLGGGTAADLLLLHKSAIERVERVQGIDITSRVRWVGTEEVAETSPAAAERNRAV